MTNITIPYAPRPLQASLHDELTGYRWAVIVCHRRWGKTVMAVNHLLRAAIMCQRPNPRFAMIGPTYRQMKQVAWDYAKMYARDIPGVRFHETELRVDLPNGARIQLLGSEQPDSLRGIYLDGCVMDEMAQQPESIFPEIIRPALSDRNDPDVPTFCYFIGTPQGHNAFYDLFEQATDQDDWLAVTYRASETGIVPPDELTAARSMMTEDQYLQEFECSWVANIPGAIFGKELQKALEDGRITEVPYDRSMKVDTHWDLGIGDSTAIWFTQSLPGGRVHVIDYYEARNEGLPHYVEILSKRGYLYGEHNAPHDIDVRELGSGKSRRETAWDLGINFRVVPKLPVEDGIHAAQLLIERCWFDRDNCKAGLEALRQYHRAYNERLRTFRATPVHDWASHAADAWRYAAIAIPRKRGTGQAPQRHAEMAYNPFDRQIA